MDIIEEFKGALKAISNCSDSDFEDIIKISKIRKFAKDECYIREGEYPRSFGFVFSGLFRYYYTDAKGNDLTKGFFAEKSFITSYSALIEKRESYFTIEALEDSVILDIDYSGWKNLFKDNIVWHTFLLALVEKGYCIKEKREREFLLFDAESRYKSFLNSYPGLEKRIKQHLIASYIGITPEALSRLRKKIVS